MNDRLKGGVFSLALIALFTALIIVGAFIQIPVPAVPFTLQVLFTSLAGILLGAKRGLISVLIYIFMGLAGLPVFTRGGGITYVLQPTFGYLVGFAVGTFVEGLIVERRKQPSFSWILFAGFLNLAIIYAIGAVYFYCISNFVIDNPIGVWPVILSCVLLCLPGDIASIFVCAIAAKRLVPALRRTYCRQG